MKDHLYVIHVTSFRANKELKLHKMSHINEKPFECDTCDKAFRTNQQLKIHKMKHTLWEKN